ncbi:MAG: type II secretion system F family protein [Candidatus Aenigmatarchaeota archaeon]
MKMKIDMETKITIVLVVSGLSLFVINFLTISYDLISLISVSIVITGPAVFEYKKYKDNKEIEERFPDFLRDITENIKTGMTLTQAIKSTKRTNYGALTPHVKKIITKIDWAIPFDQILIEFSKKSTPLIQKTVSTILETYRGGGNITQVLDAASKTIKEINKIRTERFSSIYNQMITGYVIFFIFVGVLIILKNYLVPSLFSFGAGFSISGVENIGEFYNMIFQWLIILEGFFSGLVVGKMAQGSMIAGLKHSLLLVVVGYGAFLLFM